MGPSADQQSINRGSTPLDTASNRRAENRPTPVCICNHLSRGFVIYSFLPLELQR